MKRFNSPAYLEREEQQLKSEKVKKVLLSKKSRKVPQKMLGTSPENREYQYNKDYKRLLKPGMQKSSSENAKVSDKKTHDTMTHDSAVRNQRKFYKDDEYAHNKEAEHFEEDKIEIVYEEVEVEDDEVESRCRTDVSLDDFRVKRIIDKGSFGEVFLTDCLIDGKKYAMKRIKKSILTDKSVQESTENEKEILMNLSHPFLLTMTYLIENDKRYYFFLEYIAGGNLFKTMFEVKRFEEEAVKFYTAQLALGLAHLHENNLVHRDLKLENVLMDKDGYIKLCDFGLAKLLNFKEEVTHTYCGTTEYLAPEIINSKGHGYSVDWWTLGIICYEM
jgi:tRNA A-37 threonylcarbamoyl transferase component Bud32